MWKRAGPYMKRKGFKRPGEFNKNNQHGGKLWASRRECTMTDRVAGEIIEKVYESNKVTIAQLAQVRHSMSYSYYLRTGEGGGNWPEVKAQWRSFRLADLPKTIRSLKPTRIPTPENLQAAFNKKWTPECEWSLCKFITGALTCWDFHIFGMRPNVDLKKLKTSRNHDINLNEGYGRTQMVDGRSKLHLSKRGTREWWCYRVCTCKGRHKTPRPREMRVNKEGMPKKIPTWNTCCPLNAMTFLQYHQPDAASWRPYPKWSKTHSAYGGQNHGDVPALANDWLHIQGQHADDQGGRFDHNSGRKSLARWLAFLKVPYRHSMHIHGDLELVWRHSYQDQLDRSNYRVREQSTDVDLATKALRKLAMWISKGGQPKAELKERLQGILEDMDD